MLNFIDILDILIFFLPKKYNIINKSCNSNIKTNVLNKYKKDVKLIKK